MTKKIKRDILIITYAVCLFALLNNFSMIIVFLKKLLSLCLPVVLAFSMAFILNVPMRGFEHLIDYLSNKSKKKVSSKVKISISLLLSIISILLVLIIVFTIAIPKITESVMNLITAVNKRIPDFLIFLEEKGFDTTFITTKLSEFNLEEIIKQVMQGTFTIVGTAVDATVAAVKFFSVAFFAIIIAIYLLLDKRNLSRQTKKLCASFLKEEKVDAIYSTGYLIRDTFAKFLSGQCLEAVILALLIFTLFSIFGLPYASLIALMAAVFSFVPYIGPTVACAIGVLLTLVDSPKKALICLIIYLCAQLIEQHFIYPHVVGNSVGLSPFYTIVAVLLGGNLFGIFGMIFFIPLFSVIYTLVKNHIAKKSAIDNSPNAPNDDNPTNSTENS